MEHNFEPSRVILVLLSIAMAFEKGAVAQSDSFKKQSGIGLYAGAGPTWLLINPSGRSGTYNNRLPFYGYSVGMSVKRGVIARKTELVFRLQFDRKGGSFFSENDSLYNSSGKVIGPIAPHSEIYKLDYLSMPFVIQYSIGKTNAFSVGMGGYVSKLLKAKFETRYANSTFSSAIFGLENFDYGATVLGKVSVRSKVLSDKLGAFAMLNLGLNNICQLSGVSIRPSSLLLMITYKLK